MSAVLERRPPPVADAGPPPPRPVPPGFDTYEAERRYRKQHLTAAFRLFAKYGYQEGVMGHLSVRDPEWTDHYWANPYATDFGSITASDLVLYNFEGRIVEGRNRVVHGGNVNIHVPLLKTRPDVIAAVHTHAIHSRAWSALGRLLEPVSAEAAQFYERHAVYDTYEHGEGYTLAHAIGHNRALLLKNHGLVTVGQTIDEAAWWFVSFEHAAHVALLAEAAGQPQRIPPEVARKIAEQSTPEKGWLNFQPLYQSIVREQPELLS